MAKKPSSYNVSFMDMRNAFYLAGDPRRRPEKMDAAAMPYGKDSIANLNPKGFIRYVPGRPFKKEY